VRATTDLLTFRFTRVTLSFLLLLLFRAGRGSFPLVFWLAALPPGSMIEIFEKATGHGALHPPPKVLCAPLTFDDSILFLGPPFSSAGFSDVCANSLTPSTAGFLQFASRLLHPRAPFLGNSPAVFWVGA